MLYKLSKIQHKNYLYKYSQKNYVKIDTEGYVNIICEYIIIYPVALNPRCSKGHVRNTAKGNTERDSSTGKASP